MVALDAQKIITSKLNKNEDVCFKFCIKQVREFS